MQLLCPKKTVPKEKAKREVYAKKKSLKE